MTQLWTVTLIILSTVYVGLGLRAFALARQRGKRLWVPLTAGLGPGRGGDVADPGQQPGVT